MVPATKSGFLVVTRRLELIVSLWEIMSLGPLHHQARIDGALDAYAGCCQVKENQAISCLKQPDVEPKCSQVNQ